MNKMRVPTVPRYSVQAPYAPWLRNVLGATGAGRSLPRAPQAPTNKDLTLIPVMPMAMPNGHVLFSTLALVSDSIVTALRLSNCWSNKSNSSPFTSHLTLLPLHLYLLRPQSPCFSSVFVPSLPCSSSFAAFLSCDRVPFTLRFLLDMMSQSPPLTVQTTSSSLISSFSHLASR